MSRTRMDFKKVQSEHTYQTLTQLLSENVYAWMAESLVRSRYPSKFPCDVIWWCGQTVASILSMDIDEGTGHIHTWYWTFPAPPKWGEFAVMVI